MSIDETSSVGSTGCQEPGPGKSAWRKTDKKTESVAVPIVRNASSDSQKPLPKPPPRPQPQNIGGPPKKPLPPRPLKDRPLEDRVNIIMEDFSRLRDFLKKHPDDKLALLYQDTLKKEFAPVIQEFFLKKDDEFYLSKNGERLCHEDYRVAMRFFQEAVMAFRSNRHEKTEYGEAFHAAFRLRHRLDQIDQQGRKGEQIEDRTRDLSSVLPPLQPKRLVDDVD